MSVRLSLLAILDQGPCYGYQLRLEYEKRTGGTRPLNVGQVYATLDRLERDGLVTKSAANEAGHVVYAISPAGGAEASAWLASASDPAEFAAKLALASTLPGVDAAALVAAQRAVTSATLDGLRSDSGGDLSRRVIRESLAFAAEAELAWLDRCESLLASAEPFALVAEPPKRGRPTRV